MPMSGFQKNYQTVCSSNIFRRSVHLVVHAMITTAPCLRKRQFWRFILQSHQFLFNLTVSFLMCMDLYLIYSKMTFKVVSLKTLNFKWMTIQKLFFLARRHWMANFLFLVVVERRNRYPSLCYEDFEVLQISKIIGCGLKRIGDLNNEFEFGACGTFLFPGEKIMLCFGISDKTRCER